jgi:hypothetical protein
MEFIARKRGNDLTTIDWPSSSASFFGGAGDNNHRHGNHNGRWRRDVPSSSFMQLAQADYSIPIGFTFLSGRPPNQDDNHRQ